MRLLDLIKQNKEVTYYKINKVVKESFQLFFVHDDLETIRNSKTEDLKATIYVLHDNYLGDSTFTIYASNDDKEIEDKINQAVEKAKLINNEVYTLPEKEVTNYPIESNFKDYSLEELAKLTQEAVFKAKELVKGDINALEIFVTKSTVSVLNSNGLSKEEVRYDCMIEAIPTWNGEKESVELYCQHHFNEFNSEKITAVIKDYLERVCARYNAVKLDNIGNVNVLLRPEEISGITDELIWDLTYASVYTKSNKQAIGNNLQKNAKGTLLTIEQKGKIKGSVYSRSFDNDGVSLKDKVLIEDGIVKGYFGTNQHAKYLGMDNTGELLCTSLKPGNMSIAEMKKEPYLEIVSMSGIQVNQFNDYIGGEIRLAYYFDGNKVTPVTSLSISGSLEDALNNIYLSKEVTQEGSYFGPQLALIKNLQIH